MLDGTALFASLDRVDAPIIHADWLDGLERLPGSANLTSAAHGPPYVARYIAWRSNRAASGRRNDAITVPAWRWYDQRSKVRCRH